MDCGFNCSNLGIDRLYDDSLFNDGTFKTDKYVEFELKKTIDSLIELMEPVSDDLSDDET